MRDAGRIDGMTGGGSQVNRLECRGRSVTGPGVRRRRERVFPASAHDDVLRIGCDLGGLRTGVEDGRQNRLWPEPPAEVFGAGEAVVRL